ncbi:hypothetical protein [Brevundimonas balnearis]|uniref:Periplasmic binding protein n=1 Tax=Brevundimonas balnearis TaxID=1572858 RepID=A0ABV6R860_9CAUL
MLDRRALLIAAASLTAPLAACGRQPTVVEGGVLAAGQPAALLVFALAPERLIGWPRRPAPDALALLPPSADRPETGALASGGPPIGVEAAAATRPAIVIDYGDLDADYQALAARVRRELDVPYTLIDGALSATPDAFRQAGRALGLDAIAARYAEDAEALLAALRPGSGPSYYLARGDDGLETAFPDALAAQVLQAGGWANVATGGENLGRVSREQIAAWDPEVIVTQVPRFAEAVANDPFWRRRRSGAPRRLVLLPDRPFGWIDKPPSVNRLLGVAWLASRDPLGPPDPALAQTVAALHERLYHRRPTPEETLSLLPRVFA